MFRNAVKRAALISTEYKCYVSAYKSLLSEIILLQIFNMIQVKEHNILAFMESLLTKINKMIKSIVDDSCMGKISINNIITVERRNKLLLSNVESYKTTLF